MRDDTSHNLLDSESKSLLSSQDPPPALPRKQRLPYTAIITALSTIIFLQAIALLGLVLSKTTTTSSATPTAYKSPNLNADLKASSAYSPILDTLPLNPRLLTFNGLIHDNTTLWRLPPSPRVDAAWDYISAENHELITVSSAAIAHSGKGPSFAIRAPPSWGYGDDAYPVQVDVFHQIHCLNVLRKGLWRGYYYGDDADEEWRWAHEGHCVHMLLQVLMCNADVGIVVHNWVRNEKLAEPKTRPMPNFGLVKKCKDFEGLLAWVREKGVQAAHQKFEGLRWRAGENIVPGDGYV